MKITEVRIFLKEGPDKKLKAYATLTFDNCFVVRNVKVIQGNKGLFVAMPSRKVRENCPKCNYKNAIRSKFCNQCGSKLPQAPLQTEQVPAGQRQSEHRDIAHPITLECRAEIQRRVLDAYEKDSKSLPRQKSEAKPAIQQPLPPLQDDISIPIKESEDEIEGKDIAL